jgi:phage tail-like protein
MPTTSSYLRYLPPVLWETPGDASIALGSFLCIFEKFLTGLDDGVAAAAPSIKELIDGLPKLYDPWQTPAAFLPWLASWVGLALPQGWDEGRRRRTISDMVSKVFATRGARDGLALLLYLYTDGPQLAPPTAGTPGPQVQFPDLQPRIAIDDGNKLLAARLDPRRPVSPFTIQSQGPYWNKSSLLLQGLVRPQCLAIAPNGSLFVGDNGYPDNNAAAPKVAPRLWHLNATGDYTFVNGRPQPQQLINTSTGASTDWTFTFAVGMAILGAGNNYQVYLLDRKVQTTGNTATTVYTLYSLSSTTAFQPATPLSTVAGWPPAVPNGVTFSPVAMLANLGTGELILLDRGADLATTNAPSPGIVVIGKLGTLSPVTIQRVAVANVVEPLSMIQLANGDFLIGDGANGNLVRVQVNRSATSWTATSQVVSLPSSPLVAPTALALTDTGDVLVVDTGLRPARPAASNSFWPDVANPAAVYRINLVAGTVALAVSPGRFVNPQAIAVAGKIAYLCDPGMPPTNVPQDWRILPSRIGVVVHFPKALLPASPPPNSPPSTPNPRRDAINNVLTTIRDILSQELPAQTYCYDLLTESG